MPRTLADASRDVIFCEKVAGSAPVLSQLLIKFSRDHLMVPSHLILKVQKAQNFEEQLSLAINSVNEAYKNTLMEIFYHFTRLAKHIPVTELADLLTGAKFCNNLFSKRALINMMNNFDEFFGISRVCSARRIFFLIKKDLIKTCSAG